MTDNLLLLATTNRGKVRELKKLLKGLSFKIESLDKYPEFGRYRETGRTFEANSRGKSLFYSRRYPGLVLAEDSGLEVEALGGQPGVFSARFSGPRASDEKNIRKLLRLLAGLPRSLRRARFVCVVSLARQGRIIKCFKGSVSGYILTEPDGRNGFGYDPVFYYAPLRKSFARLKAEEKNQVSHRGRALKKVRRFLAGRWRQ
ncbi:MAG: RdgB/HAM1 family non-canonical purine NTP pyrophosphatase [Candidatus Saccharicenans sp.]|uniref:RdgB/HAM1 family non-canonical purine NTP pyrophosphatase n=1 Tax=Candidatus Saccharicenans sp. TaxID=2819258 RepID=UPI00404A3A2B